MRTIYSDGRMLNEVVEKVGVFHQEISWHVFGTCAVESTPMLAIIEADRLDALLILEKGEADIENSRFATATDYAEFCIDVVEMALLQREIMQHRLLMGCVKNSSQARCKS